MTCSGYEHKDKTIDCMDKTFHQCSAGCCQAAVQRRNPGVLQSLSDRCCWMLQEVQEVRLSLLQEVRLRRSRRSRLGPAQSAAGGPAQEVQTRSSSVCCRTQDSASSAVMADSRRLFIVCASTTLLLILLILLSRVMEEEQDARHRRDVNSTETPAELIDPAAIDLTPLVNTLINSSQSGSRQLFSLLSVTSYSSLALHKLTLLVYNISSVRAADGNKLRRRFCYCVTNETNDLTDFTAVLLDVMGNSTSYLQELFKSASILSVNQRNDSDCIYICVMAGRKGREMSELWEVDSITPLFNQTIVEGPHRDNWQRLPTNVSHIPPSGLSSVHSTAHAAGETTTAQVRAAELLLTATGSPATGSPATEQRAETLTTSQLTSRTTGSASVHGPDQSTAASQPDVMTGPGPWSPEGTTMVWRTTGAPLRRTTTPSRPVEKPGCPWRRLELTDVAPPGGGSTTTVGAHKLQPCVLELCKFFSQCLCRRFSARTPETRYCDDHVWYEKHTSEVCRRVRRVSFSRNLKQQCLTKMCSKL